MDIQLPQSILSMTGDAADKLLAKKDGDAALLYLHLLRRGSFPETGWTEERLEHARQVLLELGLIPKEAVPEKKKTPAPAEAPEYTSEDVVTELQNGSDFSHLMDEVERQLGRKLGTTDLKSMLKLYNYYALPAEVILMLVNWCIRRYEQKYGQGHMPRVSQIVKEGTYWRERGIDTIEAADEYIRRSDRMSRRETELFRLLDMPARPPVEREKAYMQAWDEWGMEDEVIRLAYEKTVVKKQSMNWAYMNSILKSWHEKGLKTIAQVQTGDRASGSGYRNAGSRPGDTPRPENDTRAKSDMERMREFMKKQKEGQA